MQFVKVGNRRINLALATEIDLEAKCPNYLARESGKTAPIERAVYITFACCSGAVEDAIPYGLSFFGDEADEIRRHLDAEDEGANPWTGTATAALVNSAVY